MGPEQVDRTTLEATSNLYDRRGNLIRSTDPVGNVTTYAYNRGSPSELTAVTGPGGRRVTYTYDQHGDVASMSVYPRPGVFNETLYAYNGYGELACQVPPAATGAQVTCPPPGGRHRLGTTSYTYNWAGQVTAVTDPAGRQTTMRYDRDGNLTVVTSPDGNTTTYTYNSQGQRTTTLINGVTTARAAYNPAGYMIMQTDAAGNRTSYEYDQLGRLTKVTNPDHEAWQYTYDRSGNQASVTDPAGNITTYAYDPVGELTAVTYGTSGTPAITYAYTADGQRSSMTDPTGVTRYAYDGDGRLTSSVHTTGAGTTLSYSYAYNDVHDRVTLTYPNGQHVTSYYNMAGLLIAVRDWTGDTLTFRYDRDGNLSTETLPGAIWVRYTGTAIAVSRNGKSLARFTYSTDAAGRVTAYSAPGLAGDPGKPIKVTYTKLGQLATAGEYTYGYNAAGELRTLPSGATRTFSPGGKLLEEIPKPATPGTASQATAYAYDGQGNRIAVNPPSGPGAELTYNQANQLTGYASGGTTATYTYNGNGLRMTKTVNGTTSAFTWDQTAATPLLLADSATSYVYGPGGQPVEQITHGTPTFLISDRQGSTRLLTSKAGQIVGTYSYGPYGTVTSHTGSATTNLQYDGQFTDAETSYIYLRARYYDPGTAQFLTQDPADALTGMPYGYAGNDPINSADPTGLSWWNPFSWSPKTWTVIGWIAVGVGVAGFLAATILTGGADLPVLGALGLGAGDVAATDIAVGAADAAAAGAADVTGTDVVIGAVAGSAASDISSSDTSVAPLDAAASAEGPNGKPFLQSVLRIIRFVRAAARWVSLASDTATAAQTCSSPNQSTTSCLTSVAMAGGSAWDVAHHYWPKRPVPLQ